MACIETNDNKLAIEMLNDVCGIIQSIEYDNAAQIDYDLTNLKKHILDFEAVFRKNLISRCYT